MWANAFILPFNVQIRKKINFAESHISRILINIKLVIILNNYGPKSNQSHDIIQS